MQYVINGTTYSKEEVVHRYLPLVKHIARRHYARAPRSIELNDLVHEGVLGLMDALSRFDSSRNVKFETYAGLRINGAVIDALRASDWVPRSVREGTRRMTSAYGELENTLRRPPTSTELADKLGVTVHDVHKIAADTHAASLRSLSEPSGGEGDYDVALADTLADDAFELSNEIRRDEARSELIAAIAELPKQQRTLIVLLYFKGVPVAEVAGMMGVSSSRISQVRGKALMNLREKFVPSPGSKSSSIRIWWLKKRYAACVNANARRLRSNAAARPRGGCPFARVRRI